MDNPFSLRKLYQSILPFLSSCLIDEKHKRAIVNCTSLFPAEMNFQHFALECPLNGLQRWGDLSFKIASSYSFEFAAQLLHNLPTQHDIHWKTLPRLINKWNNSGLLDAKKKRDGLWIELDVGSNPAWPPIPNVFFDWYDKEAYVPLGEAYLALKKEPLSQGTFSLLEKCKTEDFQVAAIGLMSSRSTNTLRIGLHSSMFLATSRYVNHLKNLNYNIDQRFIQILEKIRPCLMNMNIEMDIQENILPKTCWSLFIDGHSLVEEREKWMLLLDLLISEGVVDGERRNALRNWIGAQVHESISFDSFPCEKKQQIVRRRISHVKLAYTLSMPIQAKIYFIISREEDLYGI